MRDADSNKFDVSAFWRCFAPYCAFFHLSVGKTIDIASILVLFIPLKKHKPKANRSELGVCNEERYPRKFLAHGTIIMPFFCNKPILLCAPAVLLLLPVLRAVTHCCWRPRTETKEKHLFYWQEGYVRRQREQQGQGERIPWGLLL